MKAAPPRFLIAEGLAMLAKDIQWLTNVVQRARVEFFAAGGTPDQFDRLDPEARALQLADAPLGRGKAARAAIRGTIYALAREAAEAVRRGRFEAYLAGLNARRRGGPGSA